MWSRLGLEQGLPLGDRYELVQRIGVGGMGEVWRGIDRRLRRPVAIKVLLPEMAANQAAVARFRREAETAAALQHPGITVMLDIDEHPYGGGRLVFLVMELLSGQDLRTLLAGQSGGLPIDQAVSITAQVADALAAAHAHGVVHRDIKPANLFLLSDGRVKICDFGIARLADATARLTAAGGMLGTPLYMAPEQFRSEQLDGRADLYSLGCVLYELFVGASPFEADTVPVIMYRHFHDVPQSPRSRRPDLPEHLDRLTLDLLAKDPADRPASAAAVATFLGGSGPAPGPAMVAPTVSDAAPTVPGVSSAPAVPSRPGKRRGRLAALVAVCAAALVAIGGGAYAALDHRLGGRSERAATRTPAVGASPARPSNPNPVVPGWQVMLAPGYGVAYDVPPNWKLEDPGTFWGFADPQGNTITGELAVARIPRATCVRAQAGLRGGADPAPKPSANELSALGGAADDQARKWATGAYGDDHPPRPPRLTQRANDTITIRGITAARVSYSVTPTSNETCTPPAAVVESIAMKATAANASTVGPLIFSVFADRKVPGQASDTVLEQVIGSLRPYTCPPGTRTWGNNKCSATSPTPSLPAATPTPSA